MINTRYFLTNKYFLFSSTINNINNVIHIYELNCAERSKDLNLQRNISSKIKAAVLINTNISKCSYNIMQYLSDK